MLLGVVKNVDLAKVTPSLKNLQLGGAVNGNLNITETEGVFFPKSSLIINNFKVNDFNLGSFKSDIQGNESLTDYDVKLSLKDSINETLSVLGSFDVSGDNPNLNSSLELQIFMEVFQVLFRLLVN